MNSFNKPHRTCVLAVGLVIAALATLSGCGRGRAERKPAAEVKSVTSSVAGIEIGSIEVNVRTFKREQPTSVDDALSTIQLIRDTFDSAKYPDTPTEIEVATCVEFAQTMLQLWRQQASDVKWLAKLSVDSLTDDQFDRDRVERARTEAVENINEYAAPDLQQRVEKNAGDVALNVRDAIEFVRFAADIQLTDRDRVVNVLVDTDQLQQREDSIRRAASLLAVAELYEREFNLDLDAAGYTSQLVAVVATFREKVASAVDAIELPKDTGNEKLRVIAHQTLAEPRYQIPKPHRVIVVVDERPKRRDEYDYADGRLTKTTRQWREFTAATIEEDPNGAYAIWYNTFAYYERGGTTTPLNAWVLSERFRSSPISKNKLQ